MSGQTIVLIATAAYFLLVKILRYRRLRAIEQLCGPNEMEKLTPALAQKIIHISLFYETPTTMLLGTQVALFKVWGIPTIADILLKSKGFQTPKAISRRLADTGILIATWITNPLLGPGSGAELFDEGSYNDVDPRAAIAIARVNWLHRKYSILPDDYRYNLALFVLEPVAWTERFGWRPHSPVERHAFFIFWMEIGRRMGIEDLWPSFEEMKEWAEAYAVENMKPSPRSIELAQIGIRHFSDRIPNIFGARAAGPYFISCLLDARTRRAMAIPDAPIWLEYLIRGVFRLVAFVIRHAVPPRRRPSLWVSTDNPTSEYLSQLSPEDLPRMHAAYKRRAGPWYYPEPTGLARWWQDVQVYLGLASPDKQPGKHYKSEGYRLEELGAIRFENQGHDEVMQMAERLQGALITGPWGLGRSKR